MSATLHALAIVTAVALAAAGARAQTDDARDEASRRFRRAVALFDEGNVEGALIEFEAAYERVSNAALLYNIGACHRALGHPVEAVDAWERYLREERGVSRSRRSELEALLIEQRARIGTLAVSTNVYGARVTLDGIMVGTAPLASPLRLGIGTYRVGVEMAGYEGPVREVTIAGQREHTVEILLERSVEARGSLRIVSSIPAVDVYVDGRLVDRTPARASIPVEPGPRVVEGRRDGFRSFRREVAVETGQEIEVPLELALDEDAPMSTVRLRLPDAPARVWVNGRALEDARELRLPAGPHALRLAVDERRELSMRIEVEESAPLELAVDLAWTDEARARRIEDAGLRRLAGGLFMAAGGAALALGAIAAGWVESNDAARLSELRPDFEACQPGSGMPCELETMRRAQEYLDADYGVRVWRWTYGIALLIGAAAAAAGVVLFATAPSDAEIDRGARARLSAGPGGLLLDGAF